ncbi:MAG: proline racemase family protein [Acidobacteria bacterium]|nr:proline racemase family protein [Acidobacteriota bacterium]
MNGSVFAGWNWQPPAHWTKISCIDLHAGGEPLRVLVDGVPPMEGRTVLEKRRYFRDHLDYIRKATMWEPRGHADMYGAVLTPSVDADFDAFFLHNEGYSTMCGHAVIALTTFVHQTGLLNSAPGNELTINVPAGRIHAKAVLRQGIVTSASFRNVPSFVLLRDEEVDVDGLGRVRFDVAYGGAFYAFVDAAQLGVALVPGNVSRHIEIGRLIKRAVAAKFRICHPFEEDLSFLYGTILTGPPQEPGHHSRNVCIFADGEIDRSATGSGVSARVALHYANGELKLGEKITIESIIGTTMSVEAVEQTKFGPYDAVIPEVGGTAYLAGRCEFWFDPNDPLKDGFFLR